MTKEEVLIEAIEDDTYYGFLNNNSEWNNDKGIVLAAVQVNGISLQYSSKRIRNYKEVVIAAVKNNGMALNYTSDKLKNDKEVILKDITNNAFSCYHSLLKGYKNFDEIIDKELEEFLLD